MKVINIILPSYPYKHNISHLILWNQPQPTGSINLFKCALHKDYKLLSIVGCGDINFVAPDRERRSVFDLPYSGRAWVAQICQYVALAVIFFQQFAAFITKQPLQKSVGINRCFQFNAISTQEDSADIAELYETHIAAVLFSGKLSHFRMMRLIDF